MIRKLIWVVLLLNFSCGEEAPELTFEEVTAYYPVSVDFYRTYAVQEITYNFNNADTTNYYLKEEIVDSILSSTGQLTYVLEQSTRIDSTDLWEVDSIYTVRFQNRGLVVIENNIAYQKLAFPMIEGTEWDGNAFNGQSSQTYYYQKFDGNSSSLFANETSVKVIIEDIPRSFFSQDERFEIYTRDVGLVEKNYITLNFCTDCNGAEGFVNSGSILQQRLIAYGQK
ncbi:MAG: hypothetical protein RIA69_15180 [Cyclobacteriaceae bacterium]